MLAHCCLQFQCTLHCLQFQGTLLFAVSMAIVVCSFNALFAILRHIVCSFSAYHTWQDRYILTSTNTKTQKKQTWNLTNLLHQQDSQIFQFYPRKCVKHDIFGQTLRMEQAPVVFEQTKIRMSWMDKIAFDKYGSIRLKVLYLKMARNLGESITWSAVGSSINC